jgi:hypothetical protein
MTKAKHPPTFDYRLIVAPTFKEHEQVYTTLVRLETTQLFSTFRYDLSVEEQLEKKKLRLNILGLKTPPRSLPAVGPATFSREYADLRGTFELSVQGLDGRVSTFLFRISPKRVSLVKSPRSTFVEVVVDRAHAVSH